MLSLLPLQIDGEYAGRSETYTFEPQNWKQKAIAFYQNSYEMVCITLTMLIALTQPSLVSAAFAVLTHSLLIPSFCKPAERMRKSFILHCINIALLALETAWKIHRIVKNKSDSY